MSGEIIPPTAEEAEEIINMISTKYADAKSRSPEDWQEMYQAIQVVAYEELPRFDSTKGNLYPYIDFFAGNVDAKTLRSPLSYSRDASLRYRRLLGTHADYDSFIHAAEQEGRPRFEGNVTWLNAGPTDHYAASFADVDSDFFGDGIAITGVDLEDQVINSSAVSEVLAIFAEQCDPRAYRVWTLVNSLPDWTYTQVGEQLEPPISKATVSRDYKAANAALLALGQVYWDANARNEDTA